VQRRRACARPRAECGRGLVLELARPERGRKLAPKKPQGVELITFTSHSHPDEVQMVGHQAIGRTPNLFAHCRVKHQFSKAGMKRFVQPAGGAMLDCQRPHDHRVILVMMAMQPREIVFLFHGPVHCCGSRVCQNAEFVSPPNPDRVFTSAAALPCLTVAAFVKTRNSFHRPTPTAFSQTRLQASDRVFTNAATRVSSTSRLPPAF